MQRGVVAVDGRPGQGDGVGPGNTPVRTVFDDTAVVEIARAVVHLERMVEAQVCGSSRHGNAERALKGRTGDEAEIGGVQRACAALRRPGEVTPLRGGRRGARGPVAIVNLHVVVQKDAVLDGSAVADGCRQVGAGRRWELVHLGRGHGLGDLGAVGTGDTCRSDEIDARLGQDVEQVEVVRSRPEQGGLSLIVDLRRLGRTESDNGLAVERGTIGDEERGLVVDAAVGVDAAVVLGSAVVQGTGHLVRITEGGRICHVPNRPDRELLTEQPPIARQIGAAHRAAEIDQFTHHVGHRLVDRARFGVIEQPRRVLGDAVGQFVGDDIVGARESLAVDHLRAVPERVRVGARVARSAVQHGRIQRQSEIVDTVSAERTEIEVVGHPAQIVCTVDVRRSCATVRSATFGAYRRRARFRECRVVGVGADRTVEGVLALAELQRDSPRIGVDQHQPVDIAEFGAYVHSPHQPGARRTIGAEQ